MQMKQPLPLQKGDLIGIVCPAGQMPLANANTCVQVLRAWGYQVLIGKTLGSQFHYFSGTDSDRLEDLQYMLDHPEVKAILCGRGGYGTSRIIDDLNFTRFKKHPKWIIGFSDITVLHAHLFSQLHIMSLHAPMAAAFNDGEENNEFILSLKKSLEGKAGNYRVAAHPFNKKGTASGKLIGGNLSLITHLIGSPSAIKTKGNILFLEDLGEYIYHIDRMMLQLKRAGYFNQLAGLIIGGFTEMKDTQVPFGQTVYECLAAHLAEYDFPICFQFPVGHTRENLALKVGANYVLSVGSKWVTLKESV